MIAKLMTGVLHKTVVAFLMSFSFEHFKYHSEQMLPV